MQGRGLPQGLDPWVGVVAWEGEGWPPCTVSASDPISLPAVPQGSCTTRRSPQTRGRWSQPPGTSASSSGRAHPKPSQCTSWATPSPTSCLPSWTSTMSASACRSLVSWAGLWDRRVSRSHGLRELVGAWTQSWGGVVGPVLDSRSASGAAALPWLDTASLCCAGLGSGPPNTAGVQGLCCKPLLMVAGKEAAQGPQSLSSPPAQGS